MYCQYIGLFQILLLRILKFLVRVNPKIILFLHNFAGHICVVVNDGPPPQAHLSEKIHDNNIFLHVRENHRLWITEMCFYGIEIILSLTFFIVDVCLNARRH